MIQLLGDRMGIARLIGEYKYLHEIAILQPERWEEIIRTRTANGVAKKLSTEFILKLYNIIHEESILQQTIQMEKEKKASDRDLETVREKLREIQSVRI